jgi:serine/threonine protein kinase
VLDELGRGAFGCVHKARHLPTGQLVCVKAVEAAAAGPQSEASLQQQKREVAVLACLQHPNIIK